jgi:hypothetical protein
VERFTRKDARRAFERLAEATGATIADPTWAIDDPRREGAWTLDYNGVYGGFVICAYVKSTTIEGHAQTYTAITNPLGMERRPAREFWYTVHFAIRVLELKR